MAKKRTKASASVEDRLRSFRQAKINELKGIEEWIEALRKLIEINPQDAWAAGMLRHYTKQREEVSKTISAIANASNDS